MEEKLQVIRGISVPDEKGQMKLGSVVYCLLDVFKEGFAISKINIGGIWYNFKIVRKFKNQEEAEKYAKENKIRLAYSAQVML